LKLKIHRIAQVVLGGFAAVFSSLMFSGCLVAGVSSGGGFFIWPSGIGLLLLVLIVVFILRRR
jgi:hypothetical protein